MEPLSNALIKEIADSLDSGLRCFIHPETGEFAQYPDFDGPDADREDFFSEFEVHERKAEKAKYTIVLHAWREITPMDSRKSFEVMQDFAEQVNDKRLQERLLRALKGRRLFANFKDEVDDAGADRKKWYAFKMQRLCMHVREHLQAWKSI